MRESVIGREMNVCKGEGKKKNEIEGGSIWNYFFLHFLLHVDNYVILFERKERWIIFINSFFTHSIFRKGGSIIFYLFVSRVVNFFFHIFRYFIFPRLLIRTENGTPGKKKMPKVQETRWAKDINDSSFYHSTDFYYYYVSFRSERIQKNISSSFLRSWNITFPLRCHRHEIIFFSIQVFLIKCRRETRFYSIWKQTPCRPCQRILYGRVSLPAFTHFKHLLPI